MLSPLLISKILGFYSSLLYIILARKHNHLSINLLKLLLSLVALMDFLCVHTCIHTQCMHRYPCAQRTWSDAGCVLPSVIDCIDVENSTSTSQTTSLSTQEVLNPLPGLEKYRKRRMPGGRFQAPADQECLSCLEESLSRQNGSESRSERTQIRSERTQSRSERTCSHLEASESEEQRPHSTSGAREVSRELRVTGCSS